MTTLAETINKQYEIGLPIFNKLFELENEILKKKIIEIIESTAVDFNKKTSDLINNGIVYKTIRNDVPEHIDINYYDQIRITPFGISFKHERGEEKEIIKFGIHFKL